MECEETTESENVYDRQKLYASRLYDKIDYNKKVRFQIPIFSAIASFAFLTASLESKSPDLTGVIFALTFIAIAAISAWTMRVVRRSYNDNTDQLIHLYKRMKISGDSFAKKDEYLVEKAEDMWGLLYFLIAISCFFPFILSVTPRIAKWFVDPS